MKQYVQQAFMAACILFQRPQMFQSAASEQLIETVIFLAMAKMEQQQQHCRQTGRRNTITEFTSK